MNFKFLLSNAQENTVTPTGVKMCTYKTIDVFGQFQRRTNFFTDMIRNWIWLSWFPSQWHPFKFGILSNAVLVTGQQCMSSTIIFSQRDLGPRVFWKYFLVLMLALFIFGWHSVLVEFTLFLCFFFYLFYLTLFTFLFLNLCFLMKPNVWLNLFHL